MLFERLHNKPFWIWNIARGITAVLREAWTTSQQAQDKREKIQALSLAKDCYSMKLDLLTNATVVDDAIRFVSSQQQDKEKAKANTSVELVQDNANDIQGTSQEDKQPTTTTNTVF